MPAPSTTRRDAARIALVATAVRVVWVIAVHRPPRGLRDPWIYQRFARAIASGAGYVSINGKPTAYFPPGYPYFLGAVQRVATAIGLEHSLPLVAGLAQAILGGVAAAAVLIAGREVGRRLGGDGSAQPVGLAAGLMVALWPNLILYSGVLLSETLFIAAFAVFLAGLLRALNHQGTRGERSTRDLLIAAVALGVATLVRPQVLVVLPALEVAMVVARRTWRAALRELGVLMLGVVVLLTPWAIRNATVFHAFVPLSNNSGDNLCVGFHQGANGAFQMPAACDTGEFYIDGPAAEMRRDAETARRARQWATSHLGELPALSARKLWITYRSEDDGLRALESYEADRFLSDGARSAARTALLVSYLVIMAAAAAGAIACCVTLWRRRCRDVVILGLVLMTACSALIPIAFFGDPRFKVASTPLFALLAGVGAINLRWRREPPQ